MIPEEVALVKALAGRDALAVEIREAAESALAERQIEEREQEAKQAEADEVAGIIAKALVAADPHAGKVKLTQVLERDADGLILRTLESWHTNPNTNNS